MVKSEVRKIVVLGAGIAGIRVVQDLAKKMGRIGESGETDGVSYKIILVDKSRVHVFHADLYEVATAFNPKNTGECVVGLKETVATPVEKLIDHRYVRFVCDEVLEICHDDSLLKMKSGGNLHYDYLIVTLGSDANYFGIPGLKENSFAMKTVEDALAINCELNKFFYDLWKKGVKKDVYITIGGGGAAGVETAGEMSGAVKRLCKKYKYPREKVMVQLIEGSEMLIGLPGKGTNMVLRRLKKLKVKVYLERFITKVTKSKISLKSPDGGIEEIDSDILIWTGGVMVSSVVADSLGSKSCRGAIKVNPFLQSEKYRNVFAAGDNASVIGEDGKPLPMLAQAAYQEGSMLAENVIRLISGKEMFAFHNSPLLMLVPIGGKFAIFKAGRFLFKGFWCWVLKSLVYLRYSLTILPFWKAFRKFFRNTKIFMEND